MIRAVVIGTGFGCVTHVRALRAAGIEVVALVGRDPDEDDRRGPRCSTSRSRLTSVDEALALDGVDAVTIATPPHTHAEIALGGHRRRQAPHLREALRPRRRRGPQRCCAAAEEAGIVHLLGCEFRWDAGPGRSRPSGRVRRDRRGAHGDRDPPRTAAGGSARRRCRTGGPTIDQGGGWLGAHGSQLIDQLRVTLGEFESVSASLPHIARRT